jgi:type VI secretion system protein ImpK
MMRSDPVATVEGNIALSDGPDLEATILRPAAWRAAPPAPPSPVPRIRSDERASVEAPPRPGTCRLLWAATPLLDRTLALRYADRPDDLVALRERLLEAVRDFDRRAEAAPVAVAHRSVGRYVLCTWVDEVVARTTWGMAADWTRQGLLVTLHRESLGGERFFAIADRALRDPGRHLELLELMAVMLSLGFEGRYALWADGRRHLDEMRDRLHAAIRALRGDGFSAPSSSRRRSTTSMPWRHRGRWLFGWAAAGLAVVIVSADRWQAARIEAQAVAIATRIDGLRPAPWRTEVETPPTGLSTKPRLAARLRPWLMPEILAGRVEVDEDDATAHVTLVGDRFYASGAAEIRGDAGPVLVRIAHALDQVHGAIVVAGHTDDRPTRADSRFATNDALSLERARQVADRLAAALSDPARLHTVGFGDRQPRAPNDTDANRARNRRVEILLQEDAGHVATGR